MYDCCGRQFAERRNRQLQSIETIQSGKSTEGSWMGGAIGMRGQRGTTYLVVMLLALVACKESYASQGENVILWPGTDAFNERVHSLPLSIEDALALLVSKTRARDERYFLKTPIFIIGDDYFFAEGSKLDIPITGYFVDGKTRDIEYRKSSLTIKAGQSTLPENPFIEVLLIE